MSNLQTPVRPSEEELADPPLADVPPAPTADIPPPPPLTSVVGYEAAGQGAPVEALPGGLTPGLGFPPPTLPPPTAAPVVSMAAPAPAPTEPTTPAPPPTPAAPSAVVGLAPTPSADTTPSDPLAPNVALAPVEVAPVALAPVEVAPVEVAPVEVAPVALAPVEVAPVEVAPVEVAPVAPVEVAPAEVAVEEPIDAPTIDTPTVAAAPIPLPTLATVPAAAIPVPASGPPSHHPAQHGTQSAADWMNANAPAATTAGTKKAKSAPGRGVMRTLMVAVLAVAIGAGARIGYDKYEARDEVAGPTRPVVDGNALTAWPNIAPPAIRYTDTETIIKTDAGSRTLTTHRDLTTGDRIVNVVTSDAAGAIVSYDLEIRADEAFIQATPDAAWEPTSIDAAVGLVGDEMLTAVFTVSDLFPPQVAPYANVLDNVDRQLSLGTLRQNINVTDSTVAAELDVDPAVDVAPTRAPGVPAPTPVTHYRVIIDTEAFRAAEGAAFQTWERQLGRVASPRLEVWVDANGVVRQIVFEVDGAMVTQKLLAAAPVSNRFENRTPGVIDAADPASASSDETVGG